MDLNKLRWQSLDMVGVSYKYIKNYLNNKYNVDIKETSLEEFLDVIEDKYASINQQDALFELENTAYKKVAIYCIRDKELEELKNPSFRELFITSNRLNSIVDNKTLIQPDKNLFPCYLKFTDRYLHIKMAQIREYILDDVDEDNVVTSIKKTYYHCSKFIVDLEKNLMFLFYNDIISEGEDGFGKGKAITEKKQAFYSLFTEGTQYTLLRFNIHEYLNNYIKLHLNKMDSSDDNSVIVIETADPIEKKNNLRSSKNDGRHNSYRLAAIRYALEHEQHTVKTMECNINNRWFQFKNQGEIATSGPYFDREVIENVCQEIFPNYRLPKLKATAES